MAIRQETASQPTRPVLVRRRSLLALLILLLGAGVIMLRRPDAFTNPQFWAEDGAVWFADQYNHGIVALTWPHAGYLQTLPRLAAVAGVHLDLTAAALLFNLVGALVQVAPALLIVSRRFDDLASLRVRVVLAIVYLLVPASEVDVAITDAQYHLAILAILVVVASPPRRAWWRAFDLCVVVLSALTGPYVVLLLPAILWRLYRASDARPWYVAEGALAAAAAGLQAAAYLVSPRAALPLGASLHNLVAIVAGRVTMPAVFGAAQPPYTGLLGSTLFLALVSAATAAVVVVGLARRSHRVVIPVAFMLIVTAIALVNPIVSLTTPEWSDLATSTDASRYFFGAELAVLTCIVLVISRVDWRTLRTGLVIVAAGVFLVGAFLDPQYLPYKDLHPGYYDAVLRAAPRGTVVDIPINPIWTMSLVRR